MATTITNVIKTIFTSQGADKVSKDTEHLGRMQTRLSQTSASAGRSFAAQSQGLGGLVAAYAGAAATTFALQQAYDKLAKSARAIQTMEGLTTLAARTAIDGQKLLASVQNITKYQMTMTDTTEQLNLALSAGFDSKQIEGLSSVALKASRALGRDLTDAMTRVTRGSAKMETELLDELGIYTKIGPATKAYAAALGKTATQLTEYERRQAFVNSVIAEGTNKFKDINTTIPTTYEKISAVSTKLLDMAQVVGMVLVEKIIPFFEFLTNNASAGFAAFAILAKMVAGKGIEVLGQSFEHATARLREFGNVAENNIRNFGGMKKVVADATTSMYNFNAENLRLNITEKEQYQLLKDTSKKRALNNQELKAAEILLNKNGAALAKERSEITKNYDAAKSMAQQKRVAYIQAKKEAELATSALDKAKVTKQAALGTDKQGVAELELYKAYKANEKAQSDLSKAANARAAAVKNQHTQLQFINSSLKTNTIYVKENKSAVDDLSAAISTKWAKAGNAFNFVIGGMATGLSKLTSGATIALSAINFIVGAIATIAMASSAIANLIGKSEEYEAFLKGLSATVKSFFTSVDSSKARTVFSDLAVNAQNSINSLGVSIKDIDQLVIKKRVYGIDVEITKTKEELSKEVSDILETVVSRETRTTGEAISDSIEGIIAGGIAGALTGAAVGAWSGVGALFTAIGGGIIGGIVGGFADNAKNALEPLSDELLVSLDATYVGLAKSVNESGGLNSSFAKTIQLVDDTYKEYKNLSFEGAVVYDTQMQTAIALQSNLNNYRDIAKIMNTIGVSASMVTDNMFSIVSAADSIVTNVTPKLNLKDIQVSIVLLDEQKFIENINAAFDQASEITNSYLDSSYQRLKNLSDAGKKAANNIPLTSDEQQWANTYSIDKDSIDSGIRQYEVYENLAKSLIDLRTKSIEFAASYDETQKSLLRTERAFYDLDEAAKNGTLTLESYSQSQGTIASSLNATSVAIKNTKSKLAELQNQRAATQAALDNLPKANVFGFGGASQEDRNVLQSQLDALNAQTAVLEQNAVILDSQFSAETARRDVLYAQIEPLRKQLEIADQLKATFGDMTEFKPTIGAFNSQGKFLTEDIDKFTATQDYLSGVILANEESYNKQAEYMKYIKGLNLDNANITARLLAANTDNLSTVIQEKEVADAIGASKLEGVSYTAKALALTTEEQKAAENVNSALAAQANTLLDILGKVHSIKKGFEDQLKSVRTDFNKFLSEDKIKKIELKASIADIELQMNTSAIEARIKELQDNIALTEAKVDNKKIAPVAGAESINSDQQAILVEERKLLDAKLAGDIANIESQKQIATEKLKQDLAVLSAEKATAKAKIDADMAWLKAYGDAAASMLDGQHKIYQDFATALNKTLNDFGAGFASTLSQATEKAVVFIGSSAPTMPQPADIKGQISAAISGATTVGETLTAELDTFYKSQARAIGDNYLLSMEKLNKEGELKKQLYDQDVAALGRKGQLESELAEKRLTDAAKEGADEAKKRAEALKKLQDDYAKAIEGVTKVLLEMLQSIVKQIGEIVTKSLERKVEMAKRKEEIVNSLLTRTTEKLTEATSKQQEVLNEEISLRKEVEDSIKSLAEIQKTYIDSLTGDDRSIKESSKALIAGILDQKKKQIDLSRTISQRLRLDTQVKTLEERKLELEKQLEAATAAREAAEQRLASAQQFVAQLTDLVSGNMFTLSQSLQQFAQAIAQVQAVVNQGLSDGFTSAEMMGGVQGFANNIINSLLTGSMGKGTFSNAINGLLNAGKVLNSAGSKIATAVGSSAPLTSIRPQARPTGLGASSVSGGFWGTVGSAIGGALNGFGIGNLVGALTNDPGFGSSIGGAIGGAIGTVFASQLVTAPIIGSLAAGIGGALGMAANLVIPGIGAVIGALIGRLLSKTPKASATGQLTASGFTTTSTSQQKMPGGTAQKLADISGDTLTQFVDTLKAAGIAFKDVVNTSVSMKKDQITGASLSFAGGQSFSFGGTKADQAGVQKLAQFYLDSFIKGLRQGSLVVDKTIKGAATLQAAIDKFASSSNGTKTIERLQEAITYAENFSKIIDSLGQAVPVSMEGAIAQIQEGAASNASAIASYYTDLKKQAADFLGTSAADYAILTKAIKANALAQLGLAQDTDGSLKSIEAATAELNAGSLAIANIVAGISSFSVALTAAGFSLTEATRIVDYALNSQLSTFIGTIGKNLQDSIDILKNPATQSSIELAAIIDNAQERNKQAEGVLSELNKTASKISASTIDKAIQNVAKSAELGALEVQAYLESLDIAQLKAVIADTARIDSTTRLAAETRLAALQEADRAQALKQFIKSSREFNKALFEITQSASSPEFLGVATSALEIADKLGKTSIDTASSNIASYINNVAKGIDIVDNASNTIAALNAEYSASNITATQYVEVLDILQETTLDSVETLKSLVTSISDTTQEIYDMYTSSMDNLLTATEDVGSRFSDLLDTFKEQTMTILGIFDDTLKDVADSGNKLYDLRDTAKDAFQSAADAVTEFEKNNKLSGKTSAQLTADLSAVATKIAALSGTSVDFASFLQLATLTSQQRSLQSELTKVNSIQEEYTKLINARAAAEADYNYAKATVTDLEASATAKLIDTRITESETVQQVKEAAYDFITSQKDLKDITQLLTAANFNLNQVRFEERDRVVQVAEALQSVTTTAKSINEETAALNATTLASVQATARLNAELKYGATATTLITEAVNDATASFNSLKTVSASVQTAVRDIINIGTVTSTTTTAQISGIYDAIVTSIKNAATAVKITDSLLTDSFDGYSATITGYLTNIKTALGTAFDATDTEKYNAFVANITTTQNALNLITPTLTAIATGAASLATVTTASASISENISTFKDSIVYAVQNLLEAFSTSRKDKIDAFRESLEKLDAIGITINSTTGLKQALIDVNTKASDTASSVTTLATNFTKLSTALAGLFDTTTGTTTVKGLITQANDAIVGLATRLKTAWDAVVLNTQTAVSGSIVVSTSLSSGDSAKLGAVQTNTNTIAKNSGLFPALQALGTAGYVAGSIPGAVTTYAATGGYIEGPGSATSDSIPARLSNGEYVIKASSVKNVGKDVLDSINETGNLGYALSNMGRRGDSLVAHINSAEARLLRSKGGSGTFNPRTGLLEFFNKDGGPPANVFETQEAAKLFTDFNSSFVTKTPIASVAPGGFIRMDTAAGSAQFYPYNQGEAARLMGGNTTAMQELFSQIGNAAVLGSRPLVARGVGDVNKISYGIGAVGANASNKALNNINLQTSNKGVLTDTLAGIGPEGSATGAVQLGGIIGRVNEVLRLLAKSYGRALTTNADVTVSSGTSLQKAVVEDYVKSLNETNKNLFFDYYMLKGASSRNKAVRKNVIGFADTSGITSYANREALTPTTYTLTSAATSGTQGFAGTYAETLRKQANYTPVNPFSFGGSYAGTITGAGAGLLGFSSGGLVTSPRDSVSAMLEPGEFVLRKQAVDRMGVDNAIRLNSTGDVGNGDVEVNINNNGTSQTTVGTPEVRRENGKIIIDIILEDLRNNGPIKRQIRSMR